MSVKYKDKYYDHFQNKNFRVPQDYSIEQNFLGRYKTRFEYYDSSANPLMIMYFKKGSGKFIGKNERIFIKDNSFLVLNPNEGWEYINTSKQYIDVLCFGISNSFNSNFTHYLKTESQQLLDDPYEWSSTTDFFLEQALLADYFASGKLLEHIYDKSNEYEFDFLSPEELSIEILKSVFKEQRLGHKISKEIEVKKQSTKEETLKRLLRAYEFINDSINEQIHMDQLSQVSSLSKFHLYDSFKKTFGKTPHQYINRLKVAKAKEQIKRGNLSVSEVSDMFGFSDLPVFSKVFKKTYGKSPSYYVPTNSIKS